MTDAGITYHRPRDLAEALEFLHERGGETEILAGGTDVMVGLRSGSLKKRYLLDVSRLPELKVIEIDEDAFCVGAGVTIAAIGASELVRTHAPALAKCTQTFASRQIRNMATIGGNVAHCSPCGDTIPPLMIHDAAAVLVGKEGAREVPVAAIADGPYSCALPAGELILKFKLKRPTGPTFADFRKIGRRKALAIARISLAAMARQAKDGRIEDIKLSLGSCTPTPWRVAAVEEMLLHRRPTLSLLWEAGRVLAEKTIEITGRRSSAVYKEPAAQGLLVRTLLPLVKE
ncbi:MAG: FAD binding domain-containing protein [Desulfobacterales bacterium]